MKFKAGDIITYKMWTAGTIDNVDLFITFDASWLCKLHKIETYHDLNPDVWEVKK